MFTLHATPDSAAMAVRLLLIELNLPHIWRQIDRDAGELTSPAYRAMHPLGKIPVLETPDGPMFETAAILLWLADRHPQSGLAPAPDAPDRAAFLKWLFFTSTNLHPALMELFYPDRVAGPGASAALLPHAAARVKDALAALEAAAASGPVWLSADRATLLGYYLGMLMRWLGQLPDGNPGLVQTLDYPALHAVLAHLETRAAALQVAQAEALGPTIFTHPER